MASVISPKARKYVAKMPGFRNDISVDSVFVTIIFYKMKSR